jgi:hypothetical protein
VGLDHIEIPKGEWFVSRTSEELFPYNQGVFESYPPKKDKPEEYSKHHVLKVILDDAMQAEVEVVEDGYRVVRIGDRLQWETVDTREEMEQHLLDRNKHHLQQLTK